MICKLSTSENKPNNACLKNNCAVNTASFLLSVFLLTTNDSQIHIEGVHTVRLLDDANRNLQTSKAPFKRKTKDTSLFTSASRIRGIVLRIGPVARGSEEAE